ncbi:hypothetical protein DSL92_01865 [Billgrantia gudaonensis]|uniref:Uncharacterized protein n=1 Tax=Billgrantia gudaonensis TaxID=376427 RepID=A0A432JKF6_9GAMM|nr:hypothetical protein DSL92_01865 [Halomonas gudaonensis]
MDAINRSVNAAIYVILMGGAWLASTTWPQLAHGQPGTAAVLLLSASTWRHCLVGPAPAVDAYRTWLPGISRCADQQACVPESLAGAGGVVIGGVLYQSARRKFEAE